MTTARLNNLLITIPKEISIKKHGNLTLSKDEHKEIETILFATENARTPLGFGIGAIGQMLALSAGELNEETINSIGWLIKHLSEELEELTFLHDEARAILTNCPHLDIAERPAA